MNPSAKTIGKRNYAFYSGTFKRLTFTSIAFSNFFFFLAEGPGPCHKSLIYQSFSSSIWQLRKIDRQLSIKIMLKFKSINQHPSISHYPDDWRVSCTCVPRTCIMYYLWTWMACQGNCTVHDTITCRQPTNLSWTQYHWVIGLKMATKMTSQCCF